MFDILTRWMTGANETPAPPSKADLSESVSIAALNEQLTCITDVIVPEVVDGNHAISCICADRATTLSHAIRLQPTVLVYLSRQENKLRQPQSPGRTKPSSSPRTT